VFSFFLKRRTEGIDFEKTMSDERWQSTYSFERGETVSNENESVIVYYANHASHSIFMSLLWIMTQCKQPFPAPDMQPTFGNEM